MQATPPARMQHRAREAGEGAVDPGSQPHVRSDQYPKSTSLWGLPGSIQAALQWDNGRTYFFKKGDYGSAVKHYSEAIRSETGDISSNQLHISGYQWILC